MKTCKLGAVWGLWLWFFEVQRVTVGAKLGARRFVNQGGES